MLSPGQVIDLIQLHLPEETAMAILEQLTPEQVETTLFQQFLEAMQETSEPVPKLSQDVLDCCGTGGSGLSPFNTSTSAAFVIAAAGVPVVKFGNRGVTSQSGSFDFLEALGFPPQIPLERVPDFLNACGLVFVYAPQCYPALGPLTNLRRKMRIRTIFNFMGPLLNPFRPAYRLLGVSNALMQEHIAQALSKENTLQQAMVVRGITPGREGLDELDYNGKTEIFHVRGAGIQHEVFETQYIGESDGRTLDPQENLGIFQAMLTGEDTTSSHYRMVCLNAGAGLYVAGKVASLEEGTDAAEALFQDGAVRKQVTECRRAYANLVG